MKVILKKPRAGQPAGTVVELDDALAVQAVSTDAAWTESEYAAVQAKDAEVKAMRDERISFQTGVIKAKCAEAKKRNAIAPKDDTVEAKAIERLGKGVDFDLICESIDNRAAANSPVQARVTSSGGLAMERIQLQGVSVQDAASAYVTAREPMNKLIKGGNWHEASVIATSSAAILRNDIMAKVGSDFMLRDVVKAANLSDPDSQVGTLGTDLLTMKNLGYLVNNLPLQYISTDMSAQPVKFGSALLTRYITPPGVETWVPGVGFTTDATTIATAGTGTTQSGGTNQSVPAAGNNYLTPVRSVPGATDVSVTLNMLKATTIEFSLSKVSGTLRNLFGEQRGAQTYSLVEVVNQHLLSTLFAATWTGTKTSYTKALADWTVKSLIGVKNYLTISKVPMEGRFALLHSFMHDKLMEDTNLLQAKSILSLVNKDESAFNSGNLPELFKIKPIESQLASATNAGALTTWTDDLNPGTTNIVGFAGNQSSAIFVSRPPSNYTEVAKELGVPITAAVELVTEPDSGLTVMVFKFADNDNMSIKQRVAIMWGAAQGDPRVGFPIKLS